MTTHHSSMGNPSATMTRRRLQGSPASRCFDNLNVADVHRPRHRRITESLAHRRQVSPLFNTAKP